MISRCSFLEGQLLCQLPLSLFSSVSSMLACPPPAINLFITFCSDCTNRMLNMPKPAKPSLSLKMRSSSSSSNFASSSLDLTVATCSGLILQICLIMALSLCCKRCRFVLVSGQVSLAWSKAKLGVINRHHQSYETKEMDRLISEACNKGTILQRNYRKMT